MRKSVSNFLWGGMGWRIFQFLSKAPFGRFRAAVAALVLGTCIPGPAISQAQAAPVEMMFLHRPPYTFASTNGVAGILGDVAMKLVREAQVAVVWREVPAARQLAEIQMNRSPVCGIGWFRTDEREETGLFSRPIYVDLPIVLIARSDNERVLAQHSLRSLLQSPDLSLGVTAGYSYGVDLDGLIAQFRPPRMENSTDSLAMLRALVARRFDYWFMAPEEAESLIAESGLQPGQIVTRRLSDMPAGSARHLFCSRRVPQEILDRIDNVLASREPRAGKP